MKKRTLSLSLLGFSLLMPYTTLAVTVKKDLSPVEQGFNGDTLTTFLGNIKNLILGITFTLATIILIYGGIMYMLSSGDSSKAQKAKSIISGALIGIAIIAGAYALISGVQYLVSILA